MTGDFKVLRLSDEFGQYLLVIKCTGCAHERRAFPNLLAHLCGWDAKLADLEKRLRCSKCGKTSCHVRAIEMQKPRGTRPAH
jgi:ribosomal protein S27E